MHAAYAVDADLGDLVTKVSSSSGELVLDVVGVEVIALVVGEDEAVVDPVFAGRNGEILTSGLLVEQPFDRSLIEADRALRLG